MKTTESRRFGIADGLILIAGVAAGLGCFRVLAPDLTPQKIWDALVRPKQGWSLWYAFELIAELGVSHRDSLPGGLDADLPGRSIHQAPSVMAASVSPAGVRRIADCDHRHCPDGRGLRDERVALDLGGHEFFARTFYQGVPAGRNPHRLRRVVELGDDEAVRCLSPPSHLDRPPRSSHRRRLGRHRGAERRLHLPGDQLDLVRCGLALVGVPVFIEWDR